MYTHQGLVEERISEWPTEIQGPMKERVKGKCNNEIHRVDIDSAEEVMGIPQQHAIYLSIANTHTMALMARQFRTVSCKYVGEMYTDKEGVLSVTCKSGTTL